MLKFNFSSGLFLLALTACVSAEKEIITEPMTKSEIESALVGNTYPLGGTQLSSSKGAFYFSDSNNLEIVWEGSKGVGNWQALNNSSFCYSQTLWAGRECIEIYRNVTEGGHVHVFEGQKRYLRDGAIVAGRHLEN